MFNKYQMAAHWKIKKFRVMGSKELNDEQCDETNDATNTAAGPQIISFSLPHLPVILHHDPPID
jgi:lipopolysaccharide/colanic/teichoic acid biosynthesis glycosyltransferase